MKHLKYFAALALAATASTAVAETTVYPVQIGDETARYLKGVATLDLETPTGAVQITPLSLDHGSMSFGLAIYNKGTTSANFDISNINVTAGSQPLAVFSKDQLVAKAKNRAMWSQIGVALLAGAAAAAASQAYTTNSYRSYTQTPFGGVSHVAVWRDNSLGVLGASASVAGGAIAINGIQNRLDYTLANLRDEIIQLTTIDADASYGGRIVVEKIKNTKLPQDIRLNVTWNGAQYPFAFRLTKLGAQYMPAPFVTKATAAASPAPSAETPAVTVPTVPSAPAPPIPAIDGPAPK